jgi:stage II sporulation protein D
MHFKIALLNIFILFNTFNFYGQLKIRIYAGNRPSSAWFTVTSGQYELDFYDGKSKVITQENHVLFALYDNKIAVKMRNSESLMCDSLLIRGLTGNDRFSFRINGSELYRQYYSGDLQCISDLGVLVFINICDMDQYLAGVVRTEGGPGKNIEYLKSQAVLARTFMYRHIERHLIDGYNLCDNTHCQAFHGITTDTLVNRAAIETKGLVVLDKDSALIISAFHSNCGGETSTSDIVWLSGHSYLKKVVDPYCTRSPNAFWRKTIPFAEWEEYLKKSGLITDNLTSESYDFSQITRQNDYRIGSFSMSFAQIRNDLNLRSSFFSVSRKGESVILEGRGYGHGVGTCQEGAKVMAARGFSYIDIIKFYFSDVIIADFENAKMVKNDLLGN